MEERVASQFLGHLGQGYKSLFFMYVGLCMFVGIYVPMPMPMYVPSRVEFSGSHCETLANGLGCC